MGFAASRAVAQQIMGEPIMVQLIGDQLCKYRIDTSMNDGPYQGIHIFKGAEHIITFCEDDAPVRDFNLEQRKRAQDLVYWLNTDSRALLMMDAFKHAKFIKPHERIKL